MQAVTAGGLLPFMTTILESVSLSMNTGWPRQAVAGKTFHSAFTILQRYVVLSSSLCRLAIRISLALRCLCFLMEHYFSQHIRSCFGDKRKQWHVHTWLHILLRLRCLIDTPFVKPMRCCMFGSAAFASTLTLFNNLNLIS